jgi:hypothetical protein
MIISSASSLRKQQPESRSRIAPVNELREEAARARSLATTLSDAAAIRDLLQYAKALER